MLWRTASIYSSLDSLSKPLLMSYSIGSSSVNRRFPSNCHT